MNRRGMEFALLTSLAVLSTAVGAEAALPTGSAASTNGVMTLFETSARSIQANLVQPAMVTAGAATLLQMIITYYKEIFNADLSNALAKLVGLITWMGASFWLISQGGVLLATMFSGYLTLTGAVAGVTAADFTPGGVLSIAKNVITTTHAAVISAAGSSWTEIGHMFLASFQLMFVDVVVLASFFLVALSLFVAQLEFWMMFTVAPLAFGLVPLSAFRDQGFAPIKGMLSLGFRILMLGAVVGVAAGLSSAVVADLTAHGLGTADLFTGPIVEYLAAMLGCGLMALNSGKLASAVTSGSASFSGSDAIRAGATVATGAVAVGAAAAMGAGAAKSAMGATAGAGGNAIGRGIEALKNSGSVGVNPSGNAGGGAGGSGAAGFGGPAMSRAPSLENTLGAAGQGADGAGAGMPSGGGEAGGSKGDSGGVGFGGSGSNPGGKDGRDGTGTSGTNGGDSASKGDGTPGSQVTGGSGARLAGGAADGMSHGGQSLAGADGAGVGGGATGGSGGDHAAPGTEGGQGGVAKAVLAAGGTPKAAEAAQHARDLGAGSQAVGEAVKANSPGFGSGSQPQSVSRAAAAAMRAMGPSAPVLGPGAVLCSDGGNGGVAKAVLAAGGTAKAASAAQSARDMGAGPGAVAAEARKHSPAGAAGDRAAAAAVAAMGPGAGGSGGSATVTGQGGVANAVLAAGGTPKAAEAAQHARDLGAGSQAVGEAVKANSPRAGGGNQGGSVAKASAAAIAAMGSSAPVVGPGAATGAGGGRGGVAKAVQAAGGTTKAASTGQNARDLGARPGAVAAEARKHSPTGAASVSGDGGVGGGATSVGATHETGSAPSKANGGALSGATASGAATESGAAASGAASAPGAVQGVNGGATGGGTAGPGASATSSGGTSPSGGVSGGRAVANAVLAAGGSRQAAEAAQTTANMGGSPAAVARAAMSGGTGQGGTAEAAAQEQIGAAAGGAAAGLGGNLPSSTAGLSEVGSRGPAFDAVMSSPGGSLPAAESAQAAMDRGGSPAEVKKAALQATASGGSAGTRNARETLGANVEKAVRTAGNATSAGIGGADKATGNNPKTVEEMLAAMQPKPPSTLDKFSKLGNHARNAADAHSQDQHTVSVVLNTRGE